MYHAGYFTSYYHAVMVVMKCYAAERNAVGEEGHILNFWRKALSGMNEITIMSQNIDVRLLLRRTSIRRISTDMYVFVSAACCNLSVRGATEAEHVRIRRCTSSPR